MHISEQRQPSSTILTKCSKMTEEKQHKRHGMNGNTDGAAAVVVKEDSAAAPATTKASHVQGGRLKFFKDGKFILELERAREGERISWVSVPRKTFWPPQGTAASTPTYRQESSTSLSVSDDNSSVQSSPWQRDHSWKQSSPRRHQSKELTFYFWYPKYKRFGLKTSKSRRPYSSCDELRVVCSDRTRNSGAFNMKYRKRPTLLVIVQNLLDRISSGSVRASIDVVSPRKRFLREMEKDKVQVEDGCQKRSRNKTQQGHVIIPVSSVKNSPGSVNGISPTTTTTTEEVKTNRNCSYSITSLLADDRNIKRSPTNSPSHFNSVTQPQYCSPSSEDRWYTESVDRLRSIELTQQQDKRGYPPYPPHYVPPYIYPYSLPPYYGPNVYGRGYIVPLVYHHAPPIPLAVRHETPSCSWVAEPSRDTEHRDDNIADMPLNLSKHAG